MIKYLHINNVKSLQNISMGMSRLNLMFGMNGTGKSSVIQSLLLLRQSYLDYGNLSRLKLSGKLVDIGNQKDVFSFFSDDKELSIKLVVSNKEEYLPSFSYGDDFQSIEMKRSNLPSPLETFKTSLFTDSFGYISAEHIGPQRHYNSSDSSTVLRLNKFGDKGEFVVPLLAEEGEKSVIPDELVAKEAKSTSLFDQVSWYMRKISPGVRVHAELINEINKARLMFNYEGERLVTDKITPLNVGFGILYVLPVIVALLTSGKNSILILENPESHLHPRGQSELALLIAKAAKAGVQIICESHSDHIINGIRVAVKEKILESEDVAVTYFSKDNNQNTVVDEIRLDEKGELDKYPIGLLDEWGNLMEKLF